jgi:hypothetical protein
MQRLVARHVISVFSDVRTLHFAELLQLGHAGVPGLISPPSVLFLDTAAASVQRFLFTGTSPPERETNDE